MRYGAFTFPTVVVESMKEAMTLPGSRRWTRVTLATTREVIQDLTLQIADRKHFLLNSYP